MFFIKGKEIPNGGYKVSITFNHTIIHVLDLSMNMPVLSTDLFILNDETENFITKHLIKIFEGSSTNEAVFKENAPMIERLAVPLTPEYFQTLSEELANTFYRYMQEYESIPSGDLLISSFMMDSKPYLSILKLNYKEEFTHFVEHNDAGVITRIIKHKGIFPSTGKQVEEGVIINTETLDVLLLDQTKSKYLALMFDLEPKLSVKETIKALETVASKVIEEHYDNPLNALSELKSNISETIARTGSIPIQEVMEQTFGEDDTVFESCLSQMAEYGIQEATVPVTDSKVSNRFASQKLKTDTGIELKFPTELFKDPDFIEIVNNPNGTLSIVLKNISQITQK